MADGPFRSEKGISGWGIRFGATGRAPVDQFGRIRSWGASGDEYARIGGDTPLGKGMLGALQAAALVARTEIKGTAGRYGTRHSELRGALCEAVCAHLNKFDWSEVIA